MCAHTNIGPSGGELEDDKYIFIHFVYVYVDINTYTYTYIYK